MSYQTEVLADSPRVYYQLGDSSGNPQDSSVNNLGITSVEGTGTITYGQTGPISGTTAILLNGKALSRTDDALLDLSDTFTLEAWVKMNALGGGNGLISKQSGAYFMRIGSGGDNKLHLLNSQNADIVGSTTTISDTTTFHHVVATKSAATSKLYIDGVDRTGTVADSTCGNNANNLMIGAEDFAVTADIANIVIGHVAVYSTALSAARILAHYQAASPSVASVAWLSA